MGKFNTKDHKTQPAVVRSSSPLRTTQKAPDTRTFEGGAGWTKDARTDLFLRATSSFHGGEKSAYEDGATRDQKLIALARQVAVEDIDWTANFLAWLRGPGNIRTASLMLAVEAVHARLKVGLGAPGNSVMPTNREIIESVLQRPDEPGEMLAYWTANHGRAIPKPIKRGIADAVRRMYSQRSLLKYDTASKGYRFGDILNLVHATPDPDKPWQGELFRYALDRRHNPDTAVPGEGLLMVHANRALRESTDPKAWLDQGALKAAGMTWEDALSAVGSKVDKAKLWETMIPSMGYMALLRNLRNFDEVGVSNQAANEVVVRLVREDEVAKSRQLPFRFYSAYKNVSSLRWAQALETALDLCLRNITALPGQTLVLTDTSGSMGNLMSNKSQLQCLEAAALFAAALAQRNAGHVDLYQYADFPAKMIVHPGGSVLRMVDDIRHHMNRVGYGTNIAGSVQQTYSGHDRVIIFTDNQGNTGQTAQGVGASVPPHIPVYLFNVQSHTASSMSTGDAARHDLGGLSDATFPLIPRLEAGKGAMWPWELSE